MDKMISNGVDLGKGDVKKLFFKLAIPSITAQLVNVLYNIVDRIYLGHIEGVGGLALTGVGVVFPIIVLVMAFAALIFVGGAPRASIALGEGNKEKAEKILGNCLTCLVIVSIVCTVLIAIFGKTLLSFFGASEVTLPFAWDYLKIYLIGTIFVQVTLGLNAFITAQGFTKVAMLTTLIGAGVNCILDPIFIFGFNWGVSGAALATIISQSIGCVWALLFFRGKTTKIKLKLKNLTPSLKIILPGIALGVAPFIMQSTEAILTVCFNTSLYEYGGDPAVGAMTILASIMQFVLLPVMGMTQGAQPIISYNYGAKNAERVKKAFYVQFFACLIYTFVMWGLLMLIPNVFARIFAEDEKIVTLATWAIRIYFAGVGIYGIQISCQQSFIALGNAKSSVFLAVLRKIILLIPLIYILPLFFADKLLAVFLAEPIADILAVTTTAILFFTTFNKTLKKMKPNGLENMTANTNN